MEPDALMRPTSPSRCSANGTGGISMLNGRVRLKGDGRLDEDMPTLMELAFNCLAKNLSCFVTPNNSATGAGGGGNGGAFRPGVRLPSEISDRFFKHFQILGNMVNDVFVRIFADRENTPLRNIYLRNSTISDEGMHSLLGHSLHSLSMWYCDSVTFASWPQLVEHGSELRSLEIGRYVDLLKHPLPNEKEPLDFQLPLPALQKLRLNGVVLQRSLSMAQLTQLQFVDLSACILLDFSLEALVACEQLHTLIVFNVWPLEQEIEHICRMRGLRTLDISTALTNASLGLYAEPDRTLATLVRALPLLEYLDISGTNLAGTGVAQLAPCGAAPACSDIPGLSSRVAKPLQYLGLYNTTNSACRRHDIPAHVVFGEANEQQILISAIIYQDRPIMLTKVLNDLYHWLRFECCISLHSSLDVVLSAMDRHVRVKHMQISGSATLFYIIKGRDRARFCTSLKNHIIRTLLNGMFTHLTDETMMRNGCLTLCQFAIPTDVVFEYDRLVKILLHGVAEMEQEGFVQRIAIYLLNSLACQVDGSQKLFLGDLGAITTMLNLIKDRLARRVFDDVVEVAWSTMWNVTDETPRNCQRFLDSNGMDYFLGCLQCFSDKEELVRNMMGLLGNVAEVKTLRHRLMDGQLIEVFADLLLSNTDGIEVSYNAAGVLAHIASDGPDAWTVEVPTRRSVLNRMVKAIQRWNLTTGRNINYRSFEPILGLLRCYHTPECQHWAVWALANLTQVYPVKYTQLVIEEKGITMLNELLAHSQPSKKIKDLARIVLSNCLGQSHGEPMDEQSV